MSKERARRREEREREQAVRAAARRREAERRERQRARRHALTRWLPTARLRPGLLAARRRAEWLATFVLLFVANVLVWLFFDSWAARLGALVVSLLVFPVVRLMVAKQ